MLRCNKPVGKYRVTFEYIETDGNIRQSEHIVPIGNHMAAWKERGSETVFFGENAPAPGWWLAEEPPLVSNKKAYIGELCEHELASFQFLPGKFYSVHWRFVAEGVK